ncbi:MAG: DUF2971 domain-containing protein [Planctomycetes bacterium]|nr:DUF2971 domain-containing protein [Planctomycetota bacterium]
MKEDKKGKNIFGPLDYSQLGNFLKYCSNDEKVLNGIFNEHKIRFTQPAALNDPLEFNPIIQFKQNEGKYTNYIFDDIVFPSEELRIRHQLIERQLNDFGILSLTKIPDCFDMWSRYANGHRGFLIELKSVFFNHPCMMSKDDKEYEVRKVEYVDEYAVNIDSLVDEHGLIPFADFNVQTFFTKTSRWKDEEEYRLVRRLSDNPCWQSLEHKAHRDRNVYLFDFSLDCIESVTFGACMSLENKKKIMEACKSSGINFLQAIIIRDQKDKFNRPGNVTFAQAEIFPDLLRMGDLGMLVEQKYIEERQKPAIPVKKLSELPYYADGEKWISQYYEDKKSKQKNRPTSSIE